MDISQPQQLLGRLSPKTFMARHWQKKPLLVRQALSDPQALLSRAALFSLAAQDHVQSRLVSQTGGWTLKNGPIQRQALPALKTPGWTLLVQSVDHEVPAVHALLQRFRFVPDARLDDVMVSYAADGGGVGPHFDSYDVFLLQTRGRRRWRIGPQLDLSLREDVPLKMLTHFQPQEEWVLEPGDMLYLPPRYAHEGVAVGGDCMTCSVGFRAPNQAELGHELLLRLAEQVLDQAVPEQYRDPRQPAVAAPALVPKAMLDFAQKVLLRSFNQLQKNPLILRQLLGQYLSEPSPRALFDQAPQAANPKAQWLLHPATKMLFDNRYVFINGLSFRVSGKDFRLLSQWAGARTLSSQDFAKLSAAAQLMVSEWLDAGWITRAIACQ
jgi:50S ribosomal protein L16 3-hydroxylase